MAETDFPSQPGFKMDEALSRLRGRKDRLLSYLDSFSERLSSILLDLRRYNQAGAIDDARRLAHQIKGTGANLGAENLSKHAGKLERHYKTTHSVASETMIVALEKSYIELQAYVAAVHEQIELISEGDDWNEYSPEMEQDRSATREHHIYVIDDSDEDRGMLENLLAEQYHVTSFAKARDGLAALSQTETPPRLLLLDIDMPDTDGYEVCKTIKADPNTANIDVLFLSGLDSTEEILKGLDAGATDYITKPFAPGVLQTKIKSSIQTHLQHSLLTREANTAHQLVQTFLNESTRLSSLVSFFRQCFSIDDAKGLAHACIEILESTGLSVVIYFRSDQIEECLSSTGEVLPLEYELLSRLYQFSEPFIEKTHRLFAVQDKVVVLVKNMPTDSEKRGSMKRLPDDDTRGRQ